MFDNRAHTEITKEELAQTERALQKLEQAYTDNRMTKAMYLSRRQRLAQNLERVLSAPTPLVTNPGGFYGRNEINLSPRPIGYKESLAQEQELDGQMRKASESQIRQAALTNATNDADTESIMDALQSNAAPSNFQAALDSVNQMQQSQLLGTRPDFKGVWRDIANSPAVVNALRNLSMSVQSRVEASMAQGMPVTAAENYILSNARNAGAILTKEGYDRGRAAEIVKSVIDGEISMVAAQNIVSGDLREATTAIVSTNANYATQPTVSPNAAKVNTEKMSISEIVEVRNAALDTLADPLAFEEELDWAASFVEQANTTLNQRANQVEAITGNSTNQVKVSTEPTKANQGDGMPTSVSQQNAYNLSPLNEAKALLRQIINSPLTGKALIDYMTETMGGENLPSGREFSPEMGNADAEFEQLMQAMHLRLFERPPTTVIEAVQQVPSLQANAVVQSDGLPVMINQNLPEKVTKPTPPPIPKPAPAVNLAIETAMKAKPRPVPKPTPRPTINQLAKRTPGAKVANAINRPASKREEQVAKIAKRIAPPRRSSINQLARKAKPAPATAKAIMAKARPVPKPAPAVNSGLRRALKTKPAPATAKAIMAKAAKPAPAAKKFSVPIDKKLAPQKKSTKSAPITPTRAVIRELISQPSPKAMVKRAPSIPKSKAMKAKKAMKTRPKRTPAAKVANALSRLPSQKNLPVHEPPAKLAIPRPAARKAKKRGMSRKTRRMLGGFGETTTSTSTRHDPRRWSREELETGLGASTSNTTSSRTSGAYRFKDPRLMHRWE